MKFKVEGMSCEGCVAGLKQGLERLEGVGQVAVTLTPGEVTIEGHSSEMTAQRVLGQIDKLGFSGELISR